MIHGSTDGRTPGRLLGVCAELAAASGRNVTLLRAAAVLALLCAFKLAVVAYCVWAVALRTTRR